MPSTRPQSKPSLPSRACSVADVVAAQERRDQPQAAVTEAPGRLDEGQPGRLVAAPVVAQPAMALEGARSAPPCGPEDAGSAPAGEAGGRQSALQVADRLAVLTGGQLE